MTKRGTITITRDAETKLVLFELHSELGSMRVALTDDEARQIAERIAQLTAKDPK